MVRRFVLISVAAVAILGSGLGLWWMTAGFQRSPGERLVNARAAFASGHFAQAEQLAKDVLAGDPRLYEAAWLASDCAVQQKAWTRAVEYARQVESAPPAVQLQALLREADIEHHHFYHFALAERAYKAALAIDADHVAANQNLLNLLSVCGRTREMTPYILRLIRQGGDPEVLLLLVRSEVAIENSVLLQKARAAAPDDPNPLIGLAWHALNHDDPNEAETLLRQAITLDSKSVAPWLLMGRLLLRAERTGEYAEWLTQWPRGMEEVAEAWFLRGQMAEAFDDQPGAIRCYWESVRRGPEVKLATFRLVHLLATCGETTSAEAFHERLQQLTDLEEVQNRVLFATDRGRPELLLPLAQAYEAAGRLWEAYGWCRFALEVAPGSPPLRSYGERLHRRMKDEPLQQVTPAANVARTLDLSRFPLPQLQQKTPSPSVRDELRTAAPTFRDDAAATGIEFRYFDSVRGAPTHRMFEFTGGGIGVLDYDVDGHCDLFFTQGQHRPPAAPDPSEHDRLYRNEAAARFIDVTELAGLHEDGFGQGVTIGDYNADGFPDVYVANIGGNQLWMNHGDGTFTAVTAAAGLESTSWTTSTLMADVTGDGLPDLYDVNYLTADDIFDRVCHHQDGTPKQCLPQDFYGEPDQLWLNQGDGRFREATTEILGEFPPGMGLGIAAWDADGTGRLSLFVANDTTPAFFFRPESGDGSLRMREGGIEAGVAFNGSGKATACMGVAVGDIDDDGRMDFFVTNFLAEPNTLFVNSTPGFFEDQTRKYGLEEPSLPMLGFGTQFLDADLDGRLELFVANGHVDDLTRFNRSYKMAAQLFAMNAAGRFVELPGNQIGPYFERKWLGRAAARLDWNRDGRPDLVVGDLFAPVALLTNTTAAPGRHLSLRLVGTTSNRDGLGTTVEMRIGDRRTVRQLTAGDGYQCSNERRLIFGTGPATQVDELTVRWPSGRVQRFTEIPVPAELILREGQAPVSEATP